MITIMAKAQEPPKVLPVPLEINITITDFTLSDLINDYMLKIGDP